MGKMRLWLSIAGRYQNKVSAQVSEAFPPTGGDVPSLASCGDMQAASGR